MPAWRRGDRSPGRKGQIDGYIKPLLRDVDVFDWQQDVENKTRASSLGLGGLVGASETVLKNQPKTSSPPAWNSVAACISKMSARSRRFCRFCAMVHPGIQCPLRAAAAQPTEPGDGPFRD
jgi:hypothetical protein